MSSTFLRGLLLVSYANNSKLSESSIKLLFFIKLPSINLNSPEITSLSCFPVAAFNLNKSYEILPSS